jgi:hypothetical protein
VDDVLERFKALSIGEKVIIITAVVLFIVGFLPWYSVDLGPLGSVSRNGWQSPGAIWSILAVLIGLVMGAQITVKTFASQGTIPDNIGGVTWPRIHLGLGIAAVVLLIIKFINENNFLAFGFYVGFICAVALAVGGFLMFQEEQRGAGGAPASGP